jgi:hypothetical protein
MLLIGRAGYGYPKVLARVDAQPGWAAVRSCLDRSPIVTAELHGRGDAIAARSSAHYEDIAWLVDRPLLSRAPLGGWRTSRYEFALEDAMVHALTGHGKSAC